MNKKQYSHLSSDTASQPKANSKKKLVFIIIGSVLALAAIFICVWFFFLKDSLSNKNANPVFVSSVTSISGSDLGVTGRYAGVVEPQKTISVNKDDSKTVSEILVVEGQNVNAGDPLFSYNIEEMQLTLEQDKLTVESGNNTIAEYKNQIADLQKERESASSDNKLSYTIKIQTLELNIKEQEYQVSLKNKEIEKLTASIQNNVVTAPEMGIIKSINENPNNNNSYNGNAPAAFISILSTGEYRIKATITEQQRYHVSEGQPVIVHSRISPDITWTGTIESIDFENPASNDSNGGYAIAYAGGNSSASQGSSRYYFYVSLDDKTAIANQADGLAAMDNSKLIIGQHVYLEPSFGDGSAPKTGIWVPSYYLTQEDSKSFVWADNGKQKLEKREVTLGTYDSESDLYEVTNGLAKKDYIAMPQDTLKNGQPTTTDPAALIVDTEQPSVDGGDSVIGGAEAPEIAVPATEEVS